MTAPRPSRVKIVLAFAAVYVVWGSTYLAIRLAIETLPPFLMLSGGFLLLLLALATGDPQRLSLANASWTSIGAFFYLLVFGSLVGFTAYSWLLTTSRLRAQRLTRT